MFKFFLFFSVAFLLSVQTKSQTYIKCYSDFDLYKNEGIGLLNDCHPKFSSSYCVKCFSKQNRIYKVTATYWSFSIQNESFIAKELNGSYMYIFPKAKMPLEGRFIRTANENRFDTLLSTHDTLYFKKAFPNNVQLSKYFKLKDTICIVSFYYKDLNTQSRKDLSIQNILTWSNGQKASDYQIIKLTIENNIIRFVYKSDSDKLQEHITIDHLNEMSKKQKAPASLFWTCLIFRFLI